MKARLAAILVFALLAGAMALSGRGVPPSGDAAARSGGRQIKVLAVTADGRLVKHPLGQTKVPLRPRRIVSLSTSITDCLVALGVRPVAVEGFAMSGEAAAVAPHLADRLPGVAVVSHGGTVNLEAVVAADPDLILIAGRENSRWYAPLSQIAPAVFFTSDGLTPERETLILDVGEVVGQSEQADKVLAKYRQKLRRAKKVLAETIGAKPVVYLRFRRQTCVIYSRTPMIGPLLFDRLGLTPDPMVPDAMTPGGWDVLSLERLSRLRAEYIFMTIDRDSEHYWEEIAASSIWRTIPAVRHGHAYRVSRSTWFGQGILACCAMIDDVLAAAPSSSTQSPLLPGEG